jgi:hypothetical protein
LSPQYTKEDVAAGVARSSETVRKSRLAVEAAMTDQGQARLSQLRRTRIPVSVAQFDLLADGLTEALRPALITVLSMRWEMERDGLSFPNPDTNQVASCPSATCESRTGCRVTKDDQGFACGACGMKGDIITYLELRHQLSPTQALREAVRRANLPSVPMVETTEADPLVPTRPAAQPTRVSKPKSVRGGWSG